MWKAFLVIIIVTLFLIACNNTKQYKPDGKADDDTEYLEGEMFISPIIENDTSLVFSFSSDFECKVNFILPKDTIKGSILLLHGWNLPATQWCDSTYFCDNATKRNYALVIPNLEKCNYPLHIYPETLEQYKKYPSLTWIMDSLLVEISEQTALLTEGHKNFVAGISTGGRGASLLSFYMPEMFTACASISGDFNITVMKDEYLYNAWFGPYHKFEDRWKNECFAYRCQEYCVPSYIGHGKKDNISPVSQSMAMYDSICYYHPEMPLVGNFPDDAYHDYNYWKSETNNILDFFDSF
jgi:hypothetical protein